MTQKQHWEDHLFSPKDCLVLQTGMVISDSTLRTQDHKWEGRKLESMAARGGIHTLLVLGKESKSHLSQRITEWNTVHTHTRTQTREYRDYAHHWALWIQQTRASDHLSPCNKTPLTGLQQQSRSSAVWKPETSVCPHRGKSKRMFCHVPLPKGPQLSKPPPSCWAFNT